MTQALRPLLFFQRFFIPALLILLVWGIWRTIFRKDMGVGLALYITLIIVVDGFYNTGLFLPGMEKGSIHYSEVCAVFLLWNRAPPTRSPQAPRKAVIRLVACYFLLMWIAALRANPTMAGVFDFRRIVFPQMLTFIVALRALRTPDDYRRFLLFLTVPALIIALFSFWDIFFQRWLLHSEMLNTPQYWVNRKNGRSGSILLNPNVLGAFVVLVFPPLFVLALTEKTWRVRVYLGAVLLGLMFSLVETQSRAPIVAFGLALLLLILGPAAAVSRKRRVLGLAVSLVALVILMPGFIQHASVRFDSQGYEESGEVVSRTSVWLYTKKIIAEYPLFGVGLGESQFLAAMEQTDFRQRYASASLDNPHNSYLQAAVYAGIPSVVVFLLANLLTIWKGTKIAWVASSRSAATAAVFGLTVSIAGFLVCMYPDMHLFTPNVAPLYWLLFALLLAQIAWEKRPSRS